MCHGVSVCHSQAESEQTNSALALGVCIDRQLQVKSAGGYLVQVRGDDGVGGWGEPEGTGGDGETEQRGESGGVRWGQGRKARARGARQGGWGMQVQVKSAGG